MFRSASLGADTSIASFLVSGVVPTYFSVTALGQPGDLDFGSGVIVAGRTLGHLHFKYNIDIASLTISSSTVSGRPEDINGAPYPFGGTGDFRVAIRPGCVTVDPTYNTAFVTTNAGVDVKSALAASLLLVGIEENCEMTMTYTGTSTALPKAGRYEMRVLITMVSI